MKFTLIHEGHRSPDVSYARRYHEVIEEAVLAEQVGFDCWGSSEQHFITDAATVSAPEGLMSFVAARTSNIRIRFMSAVLLAFNHPIRVAERLTTLDILSNGRAELGTARSNNPYTLNAFEVSPRDTKAQWRESLAVIVKALTTETFSHDGEFWHIPERTLTPKGVQQPHPPLLVSATGIDTHIEAGEKGLGLMSGNTVLGWDYLHANLQAYFKAREHAQPLPGAAVNDTVASFVASCHCAPTMEQAREEAWGVGRTFMDVTMDIYSRLSKESPDYSYLGRIEQLRERMYDLDYLQDTCPYFHIGTPDFLIERFKRLEAMGINEVLLRIDGYGPETDKRAIAAIGKYVIPEFRKDRTTEPAGAHS